MKWSNQAQLSRDLRVLVFYNIIWNRKQVEEAKSGKDQNENLLEQMTQGSQSSSLVLSVAQCDNQIPSQEETKQRSYGNQMQLIT